MSGWLKSVNNMLEKLDDRVETAAEDASNILMDADGVPTSSAALSRFLGKAQSESDDRSYYEGDEYLDDKDFGEEKNTEESGEEQDAVDVNKRQHAPDNSLSADILDDSQVESSSEVGTTTDAESLKDGSTIQPTDPATSVKKEVKSVIGQLKSAPPSSGSHVNPPPPPSSQNSAAKMSGKSSGRAELLKAQQEIQLLTKQNAALQAQLETCQAELNAQNEELLRAADRIDEDRQMADEERDELIDEHDEALRNLKASYEASLAHQKENFEGQIDALQKQLATEAHMRAKEGGDMTEELAGAVERERQALEKVDELHQEKNLLEQNNKELKSLEETLLEEVKSLKETAQASADRERLMEEKLDAANEMHQRALSHRQTRESELERTVAELGAALALKESKNNRSVVDSAMARAAEAGSGIQKKYGALVDELDGTKAQLSQATQRCDALQSELELISRERTEEASILQEKEREHDRRVEQMTAKMSQLEASLREYKSFNGDLASVKSSAKSIKEASGKAQIASNGEIIGQLSRDLENSRRQIASLSDQLLRQQGLTESATSEVLALRGRLQSATSRAEAAEASFNHVGMYELESGGVGYGANPGQKRVRRGGQHRGRSIRSALGLRVMENSNLEQVAQTVDAIDLWMLQTGVILKHEPLARIALIFYFTLVHLWCFGLVFFHAVVRNLLVYGIVVVECLILVSLVISGLPRNPSTATWGRLPQDDILWVITDTFHRPW